MNSRKWMVLAIVVIALVSVAMLTPAVWAQGPMNSNSPGQGNGPMLDGNSGPGFRMIRPRNGAGPMMDRGNAWGGPENSLVAVVAKAVGLDRAELIAQLQGGKTMAEVAAEHEVSVDTILDAFLAPRVERLTEMVADGRLTQEQADEWLVVMRTNAATHLTTAWSPQGPGQGNGLGPVDEDGDGVCDFAGAGRKAQRGSRMMWLQTQ